MIRRWCVAAATVGVLLSGCRPSTPSDRSAVSNRDSAGRASNKEGTTSPQEEGSPLARVVYGTVDALLLNVMPVWIVWSGQAEKVGGRSLRLRRASVALGASLLVTAAYHLGYHELRRRTTEPANIPRQSPFSVAGLSTAGGPARSSEWRMGPPVHAATVNRPELTRSPASTNAERKGVGRGPRRCRHNAMPASTAVASTAIKPTFARSS